MELHRTAKECADMETMVRVALMENGVTATELSRRLGRCQRYVSTRLPRIKEEECARWLDLVLEIVEEREKGKKEKEDERRKEEAHVRQMLGRPLTASGMDDEGAVKLVAAILEGQVAELREAARHRHESPGKYKRAEANFLGSPFVELSDVDPAEALRTILKDEDSGKRHRKYRRRYG